MMLRSDYFRRSIKVLWMLTLAFALIGHSSWRQEILWQGPSQIHLSLDILWLLNWEFFICSWGNIANILFHFLIERYSLFSLNYSWMTSCGTKPYFSLFFNSLLSIYIKIKSFFHFISSRWATMNLSKNLRWTRVYYGQTCSKVKMILPMAPNLVIAKTNSHHLAGVSLKMFDSDFLFELWILLRLLQELSFAWFLRSICVMIEKLELIFVLF